MSFFHGWKLVNCRWSKNRLPKHWDQREPDQECIMPSVHIKTCYPRHLKQPGKSPENEIEIVESLKSLDLRPVSSWWNGYYEEFLRTGRARWVGCRTWSWGMSADLTASRDRTIHSPQWYSTGPISPNNPYFLCLKP